MIWFTAQSLHGGLQYDLVHCAESYQWFALRTCAAGFPTNGLWKYLASRSVNSISRSSLFCSSCSYSSLQWGLSSPSLSLFQSVSVCLSLCLSVYQSVCKSGVLPIFSTARLTMQVWQIQGEAEQRLSICSMTMTMTCLVQQENALFILPGILICCLVTNTI